MNTDLLDFYFNHHTHDDCNRCLRCEDCSQRDDVRLYKCGDGLKGNSQCKNMRYCCSWECAKKHFIKLESMIMKFGGFYFIICNDCWPTTKQHREANGIYDQLEFN